jgi:cation transport protein ChaC
MTTIREMALTAELVALVERTEPDPGPPPGMHVPDEAEMRDRAAAFLAERPDGPLWLFAYGSLIWKPETEHLDARPARIRGWHRRFCLRLTRWRGTLAQPGLMMALDRGGSSVGIAYRLPEEDALGQVTRLLWRETDATPSTNVPRWVSLETAEGPVTALAFVASPLGANYAGAVPLTEVARTLARAAGHWGSGAQYLYNTVSNLEANGIRDRTLWLLQEMVADEIRRQHLALAA